jgi:hypothetical protein
VKQTTAVILIKGTTVFLIGVFSPWAAALSQWQNSDSSPTAFTWYGIILPASVIGGCSALSAFLSSSWSSYVKNGGSKVDEKPAE